MAGVLHAPGGVPLTEYCVVSGEWFPTVRTGRPAHNGVNHAPLTTHEFVP